MVAAAMMTVLMVLAGGGMLVGSAVITRHRAQAAADLAALSAAGHLGAGPGTACASASAVAARMQVRVSGCTIDGLDVVVTVDVPIRLGRLGLRVAHASARAGPGEG